MALQQDFRLTVTRHSDRDRRGILRADKLGTLRQFRKTKCFYAGTDSGRVADQKRQGDPETQCTVGGCKGDFVVSYYDRHPPGSEGLGIASQLAKIRDCAYSKWSSDSGHAAIVTRKRAVFQ
jgi:hypothetical protein